MGELYAICFFYSGVDFVNWQWCWVIGFVVLSLSFFNLSTKNYARTLALGNWPVLVIKLKLGGV
jgi:hypothetical protein